MGVELYLPDLARGIESATIYQTEFVNCRIRGPAVMACGPEVAFKDSFTVVSLEDTDVMPIEASFSDADMTQLFHGAIGFKYCRFVNCTLDGIGFIGPPRLREEIAQKL